MYELHPWPWEHSLAAATAGAGRVYTIEHIFLGLVRDRCYELGLTEGSTIRCRARVDDQVIVELESGDLGTLDLPYAWFVLVQPVVERGGLRRRQSLNPDMQP